MNLRPTKKNLLIEILSPESKSSSGLIIPEVAQDKSNQGKVIAVGQGVEDVQVGDTVIFNRSGSRRVPADPGIDLRIVPIDDILAVL